jgi:hypothetical protein
MPMSLGQGIKCLRPSHMTTPMSDRIETPNWLTRDVTRADGLQTPERVEAREKQLAERMENCRTETDFDRPGDRSPNKRIEKMSHYPLATAIHIT